MSKQPFARTIFFPFSHAGKSLSCRSFISKSGMRLPVIYSQLRVLVDRLYQFLISHRPGPIFHHNNSAGIVCQSCRVIVAGSCGEGERERGNNRVARARYIGNFIGAIDWDVDGLLSAFEQGHSLLATSDEKRAVLKSAQQRSPGRLELVGVVADD